MKLLEIYTALLIFCLKDSLSDNCGGEKRQHSGIILSPNFPNSYSHYTNCEWTVFAPERQVVLLRFLHVDLASNFNSECADSVTIYDGNSTAFPILETLCGYHTPEEMSSLWFRSSGNTLHVTFFSDGYGANSGFDAAYNMQDCPPFTYGNESCDKSCNCVQSNTRHCNSVNGTCVCKSGWTSDDCSVDINECTTSKAELCQENYQRCVNTNGSYACDCKPGMAKNSIGQCEVLPTFKCTVTQCSHTCVKLPTNIEQCYCPLNMMLDGNTCKDCPHLRIGDECRLKCDSCNVNNTEKCDNRTGECFCNPGWTGTTCGQDINECNTRPWYELCEPSETCINTNGSFRCTVCNEVLNKSSGVLMSPNYPGSYPKKVNCETLIWLPNEIETITLTFDDIQLDSGLDSISIFDGPNESSPLIASLNGNHNNVVIRSTQNKMLIRFSTDEYVVSKGFHASYTSNEIAGCGSKITNSSGIISGGNYTRSPDDVYFCYWNFVCLWYQTISVNFIDLELGNSSDCSEGYLLVFNYTLNRNSYTNVKFCGHNVTSLIRSADYRMSMIYVFKGSNGTQPKISGVYDISECSWKYGDRCEKNCTCDRDYTSRCNNLNGNCECGLGFQGVDCSMDIDECALNECSSHLECHNSFGGSQCPYFKYGPACSRECPCLRSNTKSCDNLYGICECKSGWTGSDCSIDIDECRYIKNCTVNSECKNTPGSYVCECRPRYEFDTVTKRCLDTDECSRPDLNLCSYKEGCINTVNGFSCSCPPGRKLDNDQRTCVACEGNTWGTDCLNDCGCSIYSDYCDPVTGCVCKTGFNGRYCNEDINECTNGQHQCSTNEICVNKPGTAECQCQNGFIIKNGICSDVDECSTGQHQCSDICTNTEGSYTCFCSDGQPLNSDGLSCGRLNQSCDVNKKCPDHLQCNNSWCHCFNGLLPDSSGHCLDCNRVLTAANGTIISSNYPLNYPDDSNCTWTIITNIPNSVISISFQDFELEGCPYDYVEIYDGSSKKAKQLNKLCRPFPKNVTSTGNSMYIVFTSDSSVSRKGFSATYTSEGIETCSGPDWMNLIVAGKQYVANHASPS